MVRKRRLGGFQREVQHHEAYEINRLSRIALENLTGSELLALDRIASPAKKLKALNSAGVALRAGTQASVKFGWQFYGIDYSTNRSDGKFAYDVFQTGPYMALTYRFQ